MSEPNIPAVVGEVEAGRAAKVLREINKLIKATNTNTFDLAERLHEAKSNHYYSPEFESFGKYAKSLELKVAKSYYLVKIVELMNGVSLTRPEYEPVGLNKLRILSRLDLKGSYHDIPMIQVVKELTLKAEPMTIEDLTFEVETILGLTEDESMVWMNIKLKKLARENAVKPALALAKKHMASSQTKDEEGNYKTLPTGRLLRLSAQTISRTQTAIRRAADVNV